ncbi:3595_t:CDS:1 [Ambispora leptoticha]|uniref:3595_t:CDS:1 n=1 Tax=Ambispora leptoticha TaxID=144679 RepID=A0A9N9F382_9GLOM|nr:3595_t:CDS:1 [Ambispora leptoticha]
MKSVQSRGYSPTPKFLSINDKEIKELADYILEQRRVRTDRYAMVGKISRAASFVTRGSGCDIFFMVIEKLIDYIDEREALHEQFMERKIDRAILRSAVNSMKSEILAIKTRIELMENTENPFDDRKFEVPPAFHSCEKILNCFENKDHVFYQHPLITAPSLIAFSQLYASICAYGVELLPAYIEIANREKKRLREVIEAYKVNTIEERLQMIKIIQTIKLPSYDGKAKDDMVQVTNAGTFKNALSRLKKNVRNITLHEIDIVKDGFGYQSKPDELHYWDRTLWTREQKSACNHEYSLVVRTLYKDYFDQIIDAIS